MIYNCLIYLFADNDCNYNVPDWNSTKFENDIYKHFGGMKNHIGFHSLSAVCNHPGNSKPSMLATVRFSWATWGFLSMWYVAPNNKCSNPKESRLDVSPWQHLHVEKNKILQQKNIENRKSFSTKEKWYGESLYIRFGMFFLTITCFQHVNSHQIEKSK